MRLLRIIAGIMKLHGENQHDIHIHKYHNRINWY